MSNHGGSDDGFSVKKSVHTTMTSRVLGDHKRQQAAAAGFYSNRILGSENMMASKSKSSKILQSGQPGAKDNMMSTQRVLQGLDSPGISRFTHEQPMGTFDHRNTMTDERNYHLS